MKNYIKGKYAFYFYPPQNYELIKGHQFENVLRKGCRYLKSIKYKYYSDKMISLYNLLYAFFERSEKTQSKKQIEEVLLIKDFNIVFEDMIHYTIVKTTMFNGIPHPSLALWSKEDRLVMYKEFGYEDYKGRMD